MPVNMETDGAEDVQDFLQRIKEMGDQRDKEDEERTRKLEAEILQGRKKRQARRSGRAMSLSPTKDASTHSGTPLPAHSYNNSSVIGDLHSASSPILPPGRPSSGMDDIPREQNGATPVSKTQESSIPCRELLQSPLNAPNASSISSSITMAPSRSNTLSWQQRPSSRGSATASVRRGPLASEKDASKVPRLDSQTAQESGNAVSRSQIAESLGAKDPTFFKQTQDRGIGSAAYRKGQVDDLASAGFKEGNRKLPGMLGEGTCKTKPHEDIHREGVNADTSSAEASCRDEAETRDGVQAAASTSSKGAFRAPMPAPSNQRLEKLSSDASSSFESGDSSSIRRTMAMSPSQGRISTEHTERPVSPTKGLGGFVQSAMMKRSDSINKRWSAQNGPGISRGNSLTGNSSASDATRQTLGGATPHAESRNSDISRETTPSANSRPNSSHTNAAIIQSSLLDQTSASSLSSRNKDLNRSNGTAEPTPLFENASTAQPRPSSPTKGDTVMSPPSSPSKRWSPTKSSWLEHAINRPEPPKVLSPSASQQPAWMADFHRNKQQRGSVDLGKGPTFKEVTVGGFVRSPPPGTGYRPPSIGGLPKGFTSGVALGSRTGNSSELPKSDPPEFISQTSKLSNSSASSNPPGAAKKAPLSPSNVLDTSQTDRLIPRLNKKPETPPKKDFQTSLKPQQRQRGLQGKDEPEFKNVFGKLKKTQTQNYVAPDELKNNIMRGKTGLAKTDGPQKSNIKDGFKESILKKKEGMTAPSASTKITSAISTHPQTSTPEALAKRQQLGRSESTVKARNIENEKPAPKPESLLKSKSLQDKSATEIPKKQQGVPTAIQEAPEKPKAGLNIGFASSLAGMLQKGPSPSGASRNPTSNPQEIEDSSRSAAGRDAVTQQSQARPELTHATKGRARGPKRKPPTSIQPIGDSSRTTGVHETLPKSRVADKVSSRLFPALIHEANPDGLALRPPAAIINDNNSNDRKATQPSTPRNPSTSIETTPMGRPSPFIAQQPVDELPSKDASVNTKKPTQISNILEVQTTVISTPSGTTHQLQGSVVSLDSPQDLKDSPFTQSLEANQLEQTIKIKARIRGQSPDLTRSSQSKQPAGLPTRQDRDDAVIDSRLPPKEAIGLGIGTPQGLAQVSQQGAASISTTMAKSSKSPPLPGRKPATVDVKPNAAPSLSPFPPKRNLPTSDSPPASAELFKQIFDESPNPKAKINVDTQAILDKPPSNSSEKIKTLRKQIFEISGNGKSNPVPSQQEHILFEDSLYICTHVFGTSAGTRTSEVYLWCGDGVSPSSIEDAQLFAKKTARDAGGKLIMLQQGKETSNFFQALGGIVITRKGSNSRSDSAIYMLCGRRHLGQIAFDEVDFQPQSLCSGFPYIISARGGRLYLWKGSGACADELGCARLIGMDLGLTGEIEEIEEGREPSDFWSSFPTSFSKITNGSYATQHWGLKPACDKYATKLFTIDVEVSRPKSSSGFMSWGRRGSAPIDDSGATMETKITEVTPFNQADLSDEDVFLLDSFFETFVIHPLRTSLNPAPQHRSRKAASLYAALLFAQEYGILAASAEDRPFVPHGSVVVIAKNDGGPKALEEGEVPEGMKRCFRKWDVRGTGGGNVKVLSLADALASLGS